MVDEPKIDQVLGLSKTIDISTEDIKPYLDHYTKILNELSAKQLETSKLIVVLFENSNKMEAMSNSSKQAIADVSAIREHLETTASAVHDVLPAIVDKVETNKNKLEFLTDRNVNLIKWLIGIVIVGFVSNLLWQSLEQRDRSDLAKKFFIPLATVAVGSIGAYYFVSSNGNGESRKDDLDTINNDEQRRE